MLRLRATSGLIVAALMVSACGARLTDERLTIATEGALAGQPVAAQPGQAGTDGSGTLPTTDGSTATGTAVTDGSAAPAGSTTTGGTTATTGGSTTGGATSGGSTTTTGGGTTTGGTTGAQGGTKDTRSMPPGGNGGATDIGVNETEIWIANVSDISGPVPGLFEEAQIATKAAIEWFKATEGTIYGRAPVFRPYDAKMDTGANRSAYQDACASTFVSLGSYSAFDQGAASVVKECGIPDLRTVALTPDLQGLPNMVSADVMKPYHQPVSAQLWIKREKPHVIADAAYLYIAGEVTDYNSGMEREATAKIGYAWDYVRSIEVSESNYAPFVLDMKNAGIKHVQFQGAYQQAVKLAKAMRQQNYWPDSVMFQANVYNQDFLTLGGDAINDVIVPIVSMPLEELSSSKEAQEYAQWYQRVAPGKNPTAMGMYSWGMTKLFFQAAKDIGPQLTREKVLEYVRAQTEYTGNGLFPPQNYNTKVPNDCNLMTVVQDGKFVRKFPAKGYFCEGGAYDLTP